MKIESIQMHPVEIVYTRPPFLSTSQLHTGEIVRETERVNGCPSPSVCVCVVFFSLHLSLLPLGQIKGTSVSWHTLLPLWDQSSSLAEGGNGGEDERGDTRTENK